MRDNLWVGVRSLVLALPVARKREAVLTCGLLVVGGLVEIISLGAVFPFLSVLTNVDRARTMPLLGDLIRLLPTGTNLISAASLSFLALLVFSGALRLYLAWRSFALVQNMSYDLTRIAFRKIVRQPFAYYLVQDSSRTITGFDMISAITYSVLQPGMQALAAGVVASLLLATLLVISPLFASAAAIIMIGSYIATSLLVRPLLDRNSKVFATAWAERVKAIQEAIGGIRNILLDHSQIAFERSFDEPLDDLRQTATSSSFVSYFPRVAMEVVALATITLIVWHLAATSEGFVVMIPWLGAIAAFGQRLLPLLQAIYYGWSQMQGSEESLHEVVAILGLPEPATCATTINSAAPALSTSLELAHVGFAFDQGRPVLSDICLTIRKGERIGVVGPTGSGKSTLMDLLLGLLAPTGGKILVDGEPLESTNLARWQQKIGHVPQSIFLANDTLAANIAFGTPAEQVDHDLVRLAADNAAIATFIESLPDQYATVCGERGIRLSGGQRQRIGIARALYKRADFLVLDEATSALDSETEREVIAAIGRLSADITVFMVAHRVSTLADCDRIVHLERGRVAQIEERNRG